MKNDFKRKLLKRADIIVIAVILISVIVSYIFIKSEKSLSPVAVVTVGGEEIYQIDLSSAKDETIVLDNTSPQVTLEIKSGKIRFTDSECPDKTCEKSGWLSSPGDTAACLPSKTVVTVKGEDEENLDAVLG